MVAPRKGVALFHRLCRGQRTGAHITMGVKKQSGEFIEKVGRLLTAKHVATHMHHGVICMCGHAFWAILYVHGWVDACCVYQAAKLSATVPGPGLYELHVRWLCGLAAMLPLLHDEAVRVRAHNASYVAVQGGFGRRHGTYRKLHHIDGEKIVSSPAYSFSRVSTVRGCVPQVQ